MELETLARIAATYSLVVWLGGLLHLAFAAIPQVRMVEDRQMRISLTTGMMRRYNPASWTALTTLLVSTLYLTIQKALSGQPIPIIFMTMTIILFSMDFAHSFIYGPKAAKGSMQARKLANILAASEIPPALALPALLILL